MAKIVDGAKETLESSQLWDDGGFGMEFVGMLDIVLSKRSTFEFTNSSELMSARFEADAESVMINLTVGDRTTDIIAARDSTPTLTIGAIKKEIAAFMEDGPIPMTTEISGLEEMV